MPAAAGLVSPLAAHATPHTHLRCRPPTSKEWKHPKPEIQNPTHAPQPRSLPLSHLPPPPQVPELNPAGEVRAELRDPAQAKKIRQLHGDRSMDSQEPTTKLWVRPRRALLALLSVGRQ